MAGTKLMQTTARNLGCALGAACQSPSLCGERGECAERWRDQEPQTVRCALCPGWRHEGTVADCRDAFTEHRAAEHPGPKRRAPAWTPSPTKTRARDTKQTILAEMHARAAELGRPPSHTTDPSLVYRARKVYRTWGNALAAAGYGGYSARVTFTRDELVAMIHARAAELGCAPVLKDMPVTVGRRAQDVFGSWPDAMVAAGYTRPRRGVRAVRTGVAA